MSQYNLFSKFERISPEDWRKIILRDLKGKDFEKTLVWNNIDDINVYPYYNTAKIQIPSLSKTNTRWEIAVPILISNLANHQALENLNGGATQIHFINQKNTAFNIDELINQIDTQIAAISFENVIWNERQKNFWTTHKNAQAHLGINPFKNFKPDNQFSYDIAHLSGWLHLRKTIDASWNVLTIDGSTFKNKGASITDEIALILSSLQENLNQLRNAGWRSNEIGEIVIQTAIGPNFFFELTKVKVIRELSTIVANQYEGAKIKILAESAQLYHTHLDRETNILRMTTEAMSAILGGVDGMMLHNFKEDDIPFSQRISRNIQHLLIEESYFDKYFDATIGNYYVSHLVQEFKAKAWDTFLQIEKNGGYLRSKLPENLINEHQNKLVQESDTGHLAMIGTNQFPNPKDEFIKEATHFNTDEDNAYRIALPFEKLKLRTIHELAKPPKAYLWRDTASAQSKAKANFAYNFLQIAAIDAVEGSYIGDHEATIEEINNIQPEIVVLCFDKETANTTIPKAVEALHSNSIIVFAGKEAFGDVDLSIYSGVNIVATLHQIIDLLKVK